MADSELGVQHVMCDCPMTLHERLLCMGMCCQMTELFEPHHTLAMSYVGWAGAGIVDLHGEQPCAELAFGSCCATCLLPKHCCASHLSILRQFQWQLSRSALPQLSKAADACGKSAESWPRQIKDSSNHRGVHCRPRPIVCKQLQIDKLQCGEGRRVNGPPTSRLLGFRWQSAQHHTGQRFQNIITHNTNYQAPGYDDKDILPDTRGH